MAGKSLVPGAEDILGLSVDDIVEGVARKKAAQVAAAAARKAPAVAAKVVPPPPARAPSSLAVTPKPKVPPRAAAVASPAIISARSSSPAAIAKDVLYEAGQAKGTTSRPAFADWLEANQGSEPMFDYSSLSKVPDVPQFQLDRTVPPRGPSSRIVDALANPNVAQGINDTVQRGIEGGGMDWYNTDQLRRYYNDPEGYARLMDLMAATSPRSKVTDNVRTGSYYNYLLNNGLPIGEKPAKGYGSIAQNLHRDNVRGLLDRGGWDIFKNPKPASFSQNLQGNQAVATIDTHNFRLPGILSQDPRFLETSVQEQAKGNKETAIQNLLSHYPDLSQASLADAVSRMPDELGAGKVTYRPQRWHSLGELDMNTAVNDPALWTSKPNDNEYGYYEKWQQDQARKMMGISPAQYQASMWLGGGEDTGLGSAPEPFLRTLENRVRYTADRVGQDPETVLQHMLRGAVPLMAKGGAVDIEALAAKYR